MDKGSLHGAGRPELTLRSRVVKMAGVVYLYNHPASIFNRIAPEDRRLSRPTGSAI
jgi:hypothetical protein